MSEINNYPAASQRSKVPFNVNIKTNMIQVKSFPKILHHYNVSFTPEIRRVSVQGCFERINEVKIPFAFDNINTLVTMEKMEDQVTTFKMRDEEVKMEIKYKNSYDINKLRELDVNEMSTCMQMLEVVLRSYQNKNFISDGRRSFTDNDKERLGKAVCVYKGLSQSLKITMMGLCCNFDLAFDIYYDDCNLVEFIVKILSKQRGGGPRSGGYRGRDGDHRGRPDGGDRRDGGYRGRPSGDGRPRYERRGGDNEESSEIDTIARNERAGGSYQRGGSYARKPMPRRNFDDQGGNDEDIYTFLGNHAGREEVLTKLNGLLKKIKLTATHLQGREISFTCSGITSENADSVFFEIEDKKISVAEYFEKKYGKLKYPDLPCIVRKRKGREDCLFPLEVLKIKSHQKNAKKLDETQTAAMIKVAAVPPTIRFETLRNKIDELRARENETLSTFNVSFERDFVRCKGRVLQPPKLEYGQDGRNKIVTPAGGSWNLRDVTALEPVRINKWMFVYIEGDRVRLDDREIYESMESFMRIASSFRLMMSKDFKIVRVNQPSDYSDAIKSIKPEFVLFILPSKDSFAYKQVKWRSEADDAKIISQCVVYSNFKKFENPMFCSNIAMKINVKMRGKNWKLANESNTLLDKSTIVFGADVSHPGQGELGGPSIAAVVSSLDFSLNDFNTTIAIQEGRKEIIDNLSGMVKDKLKKFHAHTKSKPKRVIFFRDGVGESQFFSVFENEIAEIKKAFKSLDPKYNPELNYIVAQKRHNVRFEAEGSTNKGNPAPGTVVEDVGSPLYFDFYMVSHHALQGTARPVRYHVLLNESNFTNEDIQVMINNMCYQYPRATKAVSIVAPIYFSHLAAARARCYYINDDCGNPVYKEFDKCFEDQLFYM